mmetsp:Transcript_104169/g.324858  ORF Transcript_104169/g.324858 Transcript_104169/m.324858 type:complete len:107 (+) Transcript_104169:1147-1467(+)
MPAAMNGGTAPTISPVICQTMCVTGSCRTKENMSTSATEKNSPAKTSATSMHVSMRQFSGAKHLAVVMNTEVAQPATNMARVGACPKQSHATSDPKRMVTIRAMLW